MDVDKMTVDECRAWLFDDTWIRPFSSENRSSGWVRRDGKPSGLTWGHDPHPIPATLDAAAAAMPDEFSTFQMVVCECASDGSIEGQPKGRFWLVTMREWGAPSEVREARDPVRVRVIHQGTKAEAIRLAMLRYAVKARTANGGGGGG